MRSGASGRDRSGTCRHKEGERVQMSKLQKPAKGRLAGKTAGPTMPMFISGGARLQPAEGFSLTALFS